MSAKDPVKYWSWAVKEDKKGFFVTGPVYMPREVDTQQEGMTQTAIEEMAHEWFLSGSALKIDTNHDFKENGSKAVESWIVRDDHPHPLYPPGTWMLRTKIEDPTLIEKVQKGKINGYSFGGDVQRKVHLCLLSHPVEAEGTTEKSEGGPYPKHEHEVKALKFDLTGKVLPAVTNEVFGHTHEIKGTTRTERNHDHAHGIRIIQDGG